jgi:hypothetical protein
MVVQSHESHSNQVPFTYTQLTPLGHNCTKVVGTLQELYRYSVPTHSGVENVWRVMHPKILGFTLK